MVVMYLTEIIDGFKDLGVNTTRTLSRGLIYPYTFVKKKIKKKKK